MQINPAISSGASSVNGHKHHGASTQLPASDQLGALGAFSSPGPSGIKGTPVVPPSVGSAGQATSAGPIGSTDTYSALLSTQEHNSTPGQGSLAANLASLDKLLADATKSGSGDVAPAISAVA